eukprot:3941360-Amphidinium_carterae.1
MQPTDTVSAVALPHNAACSSLRGRRAVTAFLMQDTLVEAQRAHALVMVVAFVLRYSLDST